MSIRRPDSTRPPAAGLTLDERVAPAAELARITGTVALRHYRTNLTVETKADGSPVTIADRAAESAARAWVQSRFPQDGILGEEFGEERPGAARRWIIDPIDGTKTFVRGVPLWGTLVALCEGDRVLAGAAYFPAVDELVAAAPGAGCWWNGSRCRVSSVGTLTEATVLTTDERFSERPERAGGWQALSTRGVRQPHMGRLLRLPARRHRTRRGDVRRSAVGVGRCGAATHHRGSGRRVHRLARRAHGVRRQRRRDEPSSR